MTSTKNYQINPQHRNTSFSVQKSQWTILETEEIEVFNLAHQGSWQCVKNYYWGLHLAEAKPLKLGISPEKYVCYIAKFVGNQEIWHGYPVAHWLEPFDRPSVNVLNIWYERGYISKVARRRIPQGKRCTL